MDIANNTAEALNRIRNIDGIGQERYQATCSNFTIDNTIAAIPQDNSYTNRSHKLNGRSKGRRKLGILHVSPKVIHILFIETIDFVFLAHEGFYNAGGGYGFL